MIDRLVRGHEGRGKMERKERKGKINEQNSERKKKIRTREGNKIK